MSENRATQPMIHKKIIEVMRKVGAIGKDRKNTQQNYSFRGIDDCYNVLHPLMSEAGIFTTTKVLKMNREERQTNKGGVLLYTVLEVEFTYWAEDGSSISTITVGEGMDSGDKASNKALAGAHKYSLIQTFAIPTEESVDFEDDSHSVISKAQASADQDRAVAEISSLLKTLKKPESDFVKHLHTTCKRKDIETFYDLTRKEADEALVLLRSLVTKQKQNGAANANGSAN